MCGIAGYVGPGNALPVVLDCLQRLEYRGYDSWGIAIGSGSELVVTRAQGRVTEPGFRLPPDLPSMSISGGYVGLGHTRWATHGRPEVRNAHPLSSCDGGIVAVHNGIIENADELRQELRGNGHEFRSDTDSEVIPHLLEEQVRSGRSLEAAMLELPRRLHGTFAILVAEKGREELLLTRRGSPLVIGVGDGEYFPASDIPSFLPRTQRLLYVRENECVAVSRSGVFILDRDGSGTLVRHAAPQPSIVSLDVESTSKADFDHYMIKEIMEQTSTLERLIRRVPEILPPVVETLRAAQRVFLVGAGTSYHACLYGEYVFARVARQLAYASIASEFDTIGPLLGPGDVVVALSQSGETADTLMAARMALDRRATLVSLTNVESSSLAQISHVSLPLRSGLELAVAATKSYTAQLGLLHAIASACGNRAEEGISDLWQARDSIINLTSDAAREHLRRLGSDLMDQESVFLIGRGIHRVTAMEAALKLKEVAGCRAEAFPGGEMKHGPLALVEEGTPVIEFYDERQIHSAESTASELAARGAQIYTVGPRPIKSSIEHIRVDDTGLTTPISQVLPMQVLSYEMARLKNLDPDRPRNLAKAVTVA